MDQQMPPPQFASSAADYLFSGTGAFGERVYYFSMKVTGMRDRLVGPYDSRSEAIKGIGLILDGVIDGFLECENDDR